MNPLTKGLSSAVSRPLASTRCLSTSSARQIQFTAQHDEIRKTTLKIIEKDINPFVDQWEQDGIFPANEVFKKLGQAGLLGITRPAEYGGLDLDYSYQVAFLESLAAINCGGVPTGITVHTDMATPALTTFGSDYVKEQFLKPSITGDKVACVGISEPSGGSDVAALRTKAVRRGDDYVINGSKMWITNGSQADWMCLLANTSEGKPHLNKSLICLPLKGTPGVTVARRIKKIGLWSSDTAEIYFEDVRVPVKNIIGEEGAGFTYQMIQFQVERICAVITAVKQFDRLIDETIDYCRQRETFGKKLIDNQVVHFRLAELKSEVELLRALAYRAVDMMIEGEDVTFLASIGKLKAGRLARQVADECVQLWGGMGYAEDNLVARAFRDSRVMSIAGGTDEMMLGIIAKFMNILPSKARAK